MIIPRNFEHKSIIANLTDKEISAIDTLDKRGQRLNRHSHICLINNNFDGSGRKMIGFCPAKDENGKIYYQAHTIHTYKGHTDFYPCAHDYFRTLDDAMYMADALYGSTDVLDYAAKEYKARTEISERNRAIDSAKREKDRIARKL